MRGFSCQRTYVPFSVGLILLDKSDVLYDRAEPPTRRTASPPGRLAGGRAGAKARRHAEAAKRRDEIYRRQAVSAKRPTLPPTLPIYTAQVGPPPLPRATKKNCFPTPPLEESFRPCRRNAAPSSRATCVPHVSSSRRLVRFAPCALARPCGIIRGVVGLRRETGPVDPWKRRSPTWQGRRRRLPSRRSL